MLIALLVRVLCLGVLTSLGSCDTKRHGILQQQGDAQDRLNAFLNSQEQGGRRDLKARSSRTNPYGARYSINGSGSASTFHRGLAQGSAKERRRKERRKALNRKAKQGADEAEPDLKMSQDKESDMSQPRFSQPLDLHAKPAGFDSTAVHFQTTESDNDASIQAALTPPEKTSKTKHATSGEGQLGLGKKEAAGGVDSEGVSQHFQEDPSVLSGVAVSNGTLLDASGARMPHQSRAAGVDSAGVGGHLAEDVGQNPIDKSGGRDDFSQDIPRDASERGVVSEKTGIMRDSTSFNQGAISEAAEGVQELAKDGGSTEISAAGVMPSDWAAASASPTLENAAELLKVLQDAR